MGVLPVSLKIYRIQHVEIYFRSVSNVVVSGRFANVSVRQRPVRQRLKSFRQCLMSVCQRLYVSSPTSNVMNRSELYLQENSKETR